MRKQESNQNLATFANAANLAILGSVIATLGDAISSFAAVLAVEEERIADAQQQSLQNEQTQLLESLQNQINTLSIEITTLKSLNK